ncbi:hypothetical protein ATO8_19289 [Roseivivax marinus]|uniref:Uncharacterized protein n=1 Tax=Roseivivax marinus TaxID=1379903 RepID=W4HE03_9RHOB|nr:hypothetical protein [Roseivivax marinus]ETW10997.1 hypothetical protein ATO8_19289 [Roseivivax marinus]
MPEHTYIITSTAANIVGAIDVPVGAQKLLMALLREQDREQRGWITIRSVAPAERLCRRTLDVLRALGCAPRGGNARFFARAVDALADIPDLFDNIELSRDARILSWSFADPFLQAMERTEAYGLIDPTEIKLLTGKWDLALLAHIAVQRRKQYPDIRLIGGRSSGCQADEMATAYDLRRVRRPLEACLAKWAKHLGSEIIVGYGQARCKPVYVSVRVRFVSKTSVWTPKTIRRFSPNTKVVRIAPPAPSHS